jgi:hypothetical protein
MLLRQIVEFVVVSMRDLTRWMKFETSQPQMGSSNLVWPRQRYRQARQVHNFGESLAISTSQRKRENYR